ncbi:solute carrier family 2, facilitated glucose transporter member 11-like isoform X1 [Lampetra fluviatilis]
MEEEKRAPPLEQDGQVAAKEGGGGGGGGGGAPTHVAAAVPVLRLCVLVAATGIGGSFQYGFNISVISAPTAHIQRFINTTCEQRYGTGLDQHVLTLLWSTVVSVFTLGGCLGALLAGPLAIRLGRKGALLFNNGFAVLAAVLMGVSRPATSFELIIIGRLLIGINCGVGLSLQPMFLGESAPQHLRGIMAMGGILFLPFGIVSGQIMGLRELMGEEEMWPLLLAMTVVPALVQLAVLPLLPESPRFLLIDRDDRKRCLKALQWLRGAGDVTDEMAEMRAEHAKLQGQKKKMPLDLLRDPSQRWQLITVVVMGAGQQLCGLDVIYSYSTYIFEASGVAHDKITYVTIGTGVCEMFTVFVSGYFIERAGRRPLLIGGYVMMSVVCVVMTVSLHLQDSVEWMPYLSATCVFGYILSFGIGPGGVTGMMAAELFTQEARPAAYMINGSCNWIFLFSIGMVFPFMVKELGSFCFLVFLVDCVCCALYIYFILPETRNKSFLEISQEFEKRNGSRDGCGATAPLTATTTADRGPESQALPSWSAGRRAW